MSTCETKTGSCDVPQNKTVSEAPGGEKCMCEKECCIDQQMKMLMCASCEAKRQLIVDILKVKMQKAWGKKMEQAADAVMEALEAKKEAMMLGMKAKEELKNTLQGLFKDKT